MLALSEADVAAVLSMREAIDAVDAALLAQAEGTVDQPLRIMARSPAGILGAMPAAIGAPSKSLGAKLVTFFPGNAARGVHTHNAAIVLFDA
ncbi:MAG TPA: hypothetical protein VKR99_01355, partial [Candidatus Eremiobacteraceae bacterium]|nr:hypothetical protein [Candidatus Eremiobacteraceae bacterium]